MAAGGAVTTAQIEAAADAEGGPACQTFTNGADFATASAIYQELHLPTAVTGATLSFAVRVAPAFAADPPQPGDLIGNGLDRGCASRGRHTTRHQRRHCRRQRLCAEHGRRDRLAAVSATFDRPVSTHSTWYVATNNAWC